MKQTVKFIDKSGETLFMTTVGDELFLAIGNHGNKVQITENKLLEMVSILKPVNAKHAKTYTPCN